LVIEEEDEEAACSSIHNPRSAILHDSRAFVSIRGFIIILQESARRVASPNRQKRQDFKKQDSREEAGSPSFTPMFPP
jgi:hypothetical protein